MYMESEEIEVRFDQPNNDDIVPCNCDGCYSQPYSRVGQLGEDLIKCIDDAEIPNWTLDMNVFENLLYYICSFYTFNLYKMGINYLSKGYKLADLKERIPDLKIENKKMKEFIKSLPKFKDIKSEIEAIYQSSIGKAKEKKNECFLELLLTPNENVDRLFCIKLILECYYLYYKSIGDTRCKELRKYVLPLMINFYKVANSIDANLVCDINNKFRSLTSLKTSRQLKKIGVFIFENNTKIPAKPQRRYKEELAILKLIEKDSKICTKNFTQ